MSTVTLFGTFGYTLSGYVQASDSGSNSLVPASEIGYFHFEPNGFVSGAFRSSTGGSADEGTLTSIDGRYILNGPHTGAGKVIPLGVITVHPENEPDHMWNYSFIVIDDSEVMLTSAGRMPHTGAMSGIMKRIHTQILTPGGTGSRK
jgi:hypothetical protein